MKPAQKRRIERTLGHINATCGKGWIVAVVWGQGTTFPADRNHGMVVREMQLGNMDAREFRVSGDFKTVRFLSTTKLVLK